jgi:hypothetical protein
MFFLTLISLKLSTITLKYFTKKKQKKQLHIITLKYPQSYSEDTKQGIKIRALETIEKPVIGCYKTMGNAYT